MARVRHFAGPALLIGALICCTRSRQFRKCEFLHELTQTHHLDVRMAAQFTCLGGFSSKLRTTLTTPEEKFGIFGLDLSQCRECGLQSCSSFLNDDISDDLRCVRLLHERQGGDFEAWPKFREKKCAEKWPKYVEECDVQRPVLLQSPKRVSAGNSSALNAFVAQNIGDIITNPCQYVKVLKTSFQLTREEISAWACVSFDAVTCRNAKSRRCHVTCSSIRRYGLAPDTEGDQCREISTVITTAVEAVKGRVFVPRFQFTDCKRDMFGILSTLCPEFNDFQ